MPELAAEAMIPNPRLAALAPFIGAWTSVGAHPMMPGITLHGRASFQWHQGGAFLLMRTEIDEPGIPSGIAIIGSDDEIDVLTMLYFDERSVSRRYEIAMLDNGLRWSRSAHDFSQRYALTVSADGNSIHGAGEMSRDGATWEPDLELNYIRAK